MNIKKYSRFISSQMLTALLLTAAWNLFNSNTVYSLHAQEKSPATASSSHKVIHPEVPRIPAREVKEMLAKKASDIVIVDVNPADYYELWHIPNAINIPFASTAGSSDRDALLAKLPKDKLIVLYCLCEEGADSSEMALLLRRMDYRGNMVKVLEGGLIQWDAKKYPMFKKEEPE